MSPLDIRWPLGAIFTLIGGILAGYGTFAESPIRSSDAIDIAWGGVLAMFGSAMLLLAQRARTRRERALRAGESGG